MNGTRLAFYMFGVLAPAHFLIALWSLRGPEVILELGSTVWSRTEVHVGLFLGYALLWAMAALMLSYEDAD